MRTDDKTNCRSFALCRQIVMDYTARRRLNLNRCEREAMKKKTVILLFATVAIFAVSGCKPKEITGQVFIASSGGMSFKLGAVEIQLMEKQQVVNFLEGKKSSIEVEVQLRKDAIATAEAEVAKSKLEIEKAQLNFDLFSMNKSWLTNAEYLKLQAEQKRLAGIEAQLRKALSARAAVYTSDYERSANQANAYNNAIIEIENQKTQVEHKALGPEQVKLNKAKSKLHEAEYNLGAARGKLNGFPNPESYLSDFSLPSVNKVNSDAEGNFTLPRPRNGNFSIFSKAARRTLSETEKYTWLIDAPNDATSWRVLLNNNNLVEVDPDGYFKSQAKVK